MLSTRQTFPAPAFKLIDAILAVTNYTENGYDLELLHDSNAPNEVWIEARSTGKGRTGEVLVAQCWRAAVITLEEGRVGETAAILNVIGEESADQWEILGGGEWDHTESGYRLHQLSYASTAERVVAIWWEGAIRRWWDALNAPDKMSAQAPSDPALQAEGIALLRQMQPILTEVATGVRDLQGGQERILARFEQQEQRILAPILARLNAQQAEQTAAILDALETRTFPADELGRHLAVIQMALAQISIRATQIGDRQLVESARQVTEIASAPGLDIKHKLKVTIPIVPVLLSYEGEFELGSRLNLEEAWRALRGWITGG